jgi:hypothetical protein
MGLTETAVGHGRWTRGRKPTFFLTVGRAGEDPVAGPPVDA